jgi:hypothetical protein
MKKFKQLRENLNEAVYRADYALGRDASDTGMNGEVGMYQLTNSRAIGQLNAFIGAFNEAEFLCPITGLARLREKLRLRVGIDFDCNTQMLPEDGYTTDYPLTQHGGSFGTTPEHDLSQGFYEDDGIESKLGTKLVLRTSFHKNEVGMWKVDAMIIPAEGE